MTAPIRALTLVRDAPAEAIEALERRINAALPFTPTRERPCPEMLERGVYVCQWFGPNGNPILVAIQSDGRCVQWLPWREGDSYAMIVAQLWSMLNQLDPV